MDSSRFFLLLLLSFLVSEAVSQSILQIFPENQNFLHLKHAGGHRKVRRDDALFCESWRYTAETNDAGSWTVVPERCIEYVKKYMTNGRYESDSYLVANASLTYAATVNITGDGYDAWVFDIDETTLSNLPYYADHKYGGEVYNETAFDKWVNMGIAPALPASLKLYNKLKKLGFKLIFLTGRDEEERNVTVTNLKFAGYHGWDKLILRGSADSGKKAIVYKPEQRAKLVAAGYRIHGNSGDQWSDLMGTPMATRSFKLPNPMYFIP